MTKVRTRPTDRQLAYAVVAGLIEMGLQGRVNINFTGSDREAVTRELERIRAAMLGACEAMDDSRPTVEAPAVQGVCKCGAPDDGHWPDCQPASQGGTVRDMVAS